ncbi:MAG TPA: chromate efflux transporter [Anaerolineae bacterium]|nr:chromate efflux transporter [Anaerolineae bacterium]HQK12518.1 chromate efflux transporter [Anaerolineae bacterium]
MEGAKRWREVAVLFLKIGTVSFGGPAAHIALMEQETVHKRGWLTREHFLDLLAATNLVPGPNAVEMAGHIGFIHAGWPGLFAGAGGFLLPAVLISLGLAWGYERMGVLPQTTALFYGINPIVLAIILAATYRLGRAALKDKTAVILALACLAAGLLGLDEVWVLLAGGVVSVLLAAPWRALPVAGLLPIGLPPLKTLTSAVPLADRIVQLWLFFFKVGALLFGSGMVLFAFIQRAVVEHYGWLTQQQLVDAIAVGQMTPGPVTSSVTFIGYLVAGWPGAVAATLGIFTPSFIIVALVGPWIPRLRYSKVAQAFLRGVNAAAVALILAVALKLASLVLVDGWAIVLLVVGLFLLLRFRMDTVWLVLGGALAGLLRGL